MSTPVLPQLLEVDSELSAQASVLEAQLNELYEKRKGIQTVIGLFESGGMPPAEELSAATASVSLPAPSEIASSEAITPESADPKPTAKATQSTKTKSTKTTAKATKGKSTKTPKETAKVKATKTKATRGRPAKAKTAATKTEKSTAASKKTAKRSGRTANWQKYVQESYSKAPLPDVIVGVLQAQPGNVFKIADVMNAVFKEDMPKSHFLKARNRVSNILSAGARDGHWYRGRGGTYSASEKAIKAAG